MRLDVDGFFPHDHAPQDSETREIMQQHMESKGSYSEFPQYYILYTGFIVL